MALTHASLTLLGYTLLVYCGGIHLAAGAQNASTMRLHENHVEVVVQSGIAEFFSALIDYAKYEDYGWSNGTRVLKQGSGCNGMGVGTIREHLVLNSELTTKVVEEIT